MAIEVGPRDALFAAVVIPALAIAAYWWGWRDGASRRIAALEAECGRLVAAEEYPSRMASAERGLAAAKGELEAEMARPQPAELVKGVGGVTFADRESAVLNVFRDFGLEVIRSEMLDAPADALGARDALASAAKGEVQARRYTVEGAYPAVKRVLDAFSAGRMPVVPSRVEMVRAGDRVCWTMEVWL